MSLKNKHLGNGDCFVIIASSSQPLLLTEHAAHGLIEAPLKLLQKMKDLLLCVHVVVKTLNMVISRCLLADDVKELYLSACRTCSTCSTTIFLIQPIRSLYSGIVSPLLSSLLKLPSIQFVAPSTEVSAMDLLLDVLVRSLVKGKQSLSF